MYSSTIHSYRLDSIQTTQPQLPPVKVMVEVGHLLASLQTLIRPAIFQTPEEKSKAYHTEPIEFAEYLFHYKFAVQI